MILRNSSILAAFAAAAVFSFKAYPQSIQTIAKAHQMGQGGISTLMELLAWGDIAGPFILASIYTAGLLTISALRSKRNVDL